MVPVERAYFTCENATCGFTWFPLDDLLGLSPGRAAGRFEEMICELAATQPFDHVREFLRRYDNVQITETMIRETAERNGSAIQAADEQRSSEPVAVPPTACRYFMIDGGMVPIRPEARGKSVDYREAKVAVTFAEEDLKRKENGDCIIEEKRFTSSLRPGVKHFELMVRSLSGRVGAWSAGRVVFVTDGAEWIDQMRERLFPNSIHILDWYHAIEHLYECAKSLFGQNNKARIEAWVAPLKDLLWAGNVEEVCAFILREIAKHPRKETALRNLHTYYNSRIAKMRYAEFRSRGLFIGSGSVESAMKYLIQARLKQAGMKWTREGAGAVIHLREKIYDGQWDACWSARRRHFSYG